MNSCHADIASHNVLGYVVVYSELQCNLNACNNTEVSCDSNCVISCMRKFHNHETSIFTRLLHKEKRGHL